MNGHVDSNGRALVTVSIRPSDAAAIREIPVWIDTGFNGDLVLPQQQIDDLALPHSGTVKAILADGTEVALKTYACLIDWFGEQRDLEVVANEGEYPRWASDCCWGTIFTSAIALAKSRSTNRTVFLAAERFILEGSTGHNTRPWGNMPMLCNRRRTWSV